MPVRIVGENGATFALREPHRNEGHHGREKHTDQQSCEGNLHASISRGILAAVICFPVQEKAPGLPQAWSRPPYWSCATVERNSPCS